MNYHRVPIEKMFLALSDPYRRAFAEQLSKGPATVTELAEPTDVQLPAVLKHLRVLEESGIVSSVKTGRIRVYRMRPEAFETIGNWIEIRQRELNRAFDRLATLMADTPIKKDH